MTAPVMPSRVVPLRRRPRPDTARLALIDGGSAPVLVLRSRRERDERKERES